MIIIRISQIDKTGQWQNSFETRQDIRCNAWDCSVFVQYQLEIGQCPVLYCWANVPLRNEHFPRFLQPMIIYILWGFNPFNGLTPVKNFTSFLEEISVSPRTIFIPIANENASLTTVAHVEALKNWLIFKKVLKKSFNTNLGGIRLIP